jgi:5-methylcytosine-specific restriction endonuclease McrA
VSRRLRKRRLADARRVGSHTRAEWEALVAEFGGKCLRCLRSELSLSRDHVLPVALGGGDEIGNIQPLCVPCNTAKGSDATDWKEVRRAEIRASGEMGDSYPS